MNRYYIYILLVFVIVSCKKNDDTDTVSVPMRVAQIEGKNDIWGEFTYKMEYDNNKISKAIRFDAKDRAKGQIINIKKDGITTISIEDYVHSVDQDSIARLDASLEAKYGAGNYSLEDSIPTRPRSRYEVTLTFDKSRISKQVMNFYRPRADVGNGPTFDNTYIKTATHTLIYENNLESMKVNAVRAYVDEYSDPSNSNIYNRTLYKSEYEFNGDNVIRNTIFTTDKNEEGFWNKLYTYDYKYSGDLLEAITGANKNITMQYSGKTLQSATVDGKVIKYQFNDRGYVTKIDYGDGNYMNITYENGIGNFNELWYMDEIQKGLPIIK